MRDEKAHIVGDTTIAEHLVLWGSITGNVKAIDGSKFYLRGVIYGDLEAERYARVHVFGSISGDLIVMEKAKVILSGIVAGDVINRGGRLYIESAAKVLGKVKTESGETKIARPPRDGTPTH
jgi:cytoskeletal protein CcmA (bactofilin family)